ncbi:MAG: TonB-dependent receptor, partial [Bacteroidales bacterium]|nr:TonB-dependent receptor [Bacteroidales bacterium]
EQVNNREFRFVSDSDRDRFMAYVNKDSYLSKHKGQYAEAYSVYSPWVHRFDFGYKHDFKVNVGQSVNTLQLTFDIKNLANLFNSSWGVSKTMNSDLNSGRILKFEGADAEGYATFSAPKAVNGDISIWAPVYSIGQCWYASVGLKYMFN